MPLPLPLEQNRQQISALQRARPFLSLMLLCAGTIYWLGLLTLFGEWLYGAYVVCILSGIYALGSLLACIGCLRTFLKRRKLQAAS